MHRTDPEFHFPNEKDKVQDAMKNNAIAAT